MSAFLALDSKVMDELFCWMNNTLDDFEMQYLFLAWVTNFWNIDQEFVISCMHLSIENVLQNLYSKDLIHNSKDLIHNSSLQHTLLVKF